MSDYKKLVYEIWISVDNILFDERNPKDILKEDYPDYLTNKAAFIDNVFDAYKDAGVELEIKYENVQELKDFVKKNCREIKQETEELFRSNMEALHEEMNEENISKEKASIFVNKKIKSMSLDILTLKRLSESTVNDVIRNAYKIIREELINY